MSTPSALFTDLRGHLIFDIPFNSFKGKEVMGYEFFLYGIYAEGQKCHHRFKELIIQSRPAYAKGTLQKLTCGLPILSSQGDQVIPGQLVELNISENHWPILDALNGFNPLNLKKSFLVRETISVSVPESAPVLAQTYTLNATRSAHVAAEWKPDFREQTPVSLVDKLTEKQKNYIQKLSQAKGREIVPVDMALYRELISLELIIDKGRRIALTRLGLEISHFI